MVLSDLPEEILLAIFLKLPTKSIAKCRCLSKTWKAILSTPQLTKLHFMSMRPQQENLILITPSHALHTITSITDDTTSAKLELAANTNWAAILGSCDGLVLLLNEDGAIFLVNPTTMEQVEIPNSPLALRKDESFSVYGFGYDSLNGDYKIVTLSSYDYTDEHHTVETFVDVYSLKSGTWRRVGSSPYIHTVPDLAPASRAYVNGSINWLATTPESRYRSVIAAFNLAHEVFDEIPAPNALVLENFVLGQLVNLGGCLCLALCFGGSIDVWIMQEYGVQESWTKFSVEDIYVWDLIKPLCYIRDDDEDDAEVVYLTEGETLLVYNRKEEILRDMVVDGVEASFKDACSYVESLMSPTM